MSKFPSRMLYPQKGANPTLCLREPGEDYDFLWEIACEDQNFYTVIDDGLLQNKGLYYFATTHLIIPSFFSKVGVNPVTGAVLGIDDPIGEDINGMFAVTLREAEDESQFKSIDKNALFNRGSNNCGIPTYSKVNRRTEASKVITSDLITNAHQLFFKFNNHYFTPILLSNGLSCYHIFEDEGKITHWVQSFNIVEKEYEIAIDAPIEVNNILGVPITRKASLLPRGEARTYSIENKN